ncbi:MAG: polysaccharide pyruvyl transferase CsaB [Ruminococcaceae bacterium]|nr:polysaccharide pyruvyl transferase CsaB [Oscillospiraceae bacterium]
MKVVHLISGGDVGGAKTHVHSLLKELNKTITAEMICFTDGQFADEARQLDIPTHIISGSFFSTLKNLTEFITSGGFEIIHCHGSKANMYGALLRKKLGLPVVTTVHSDYKLDYMGRPFHHLTYGTINSVSLRMLDYRIGVSDPIADMLVSRGFDPHTTFSIYNGIDYSLNQPSVSRKEFFESFGFDVSPDDVVFGIAARLTPVKDMPTLIKAFAKTHRELPDTKLIIAGDGEQHQELFDLASSLNVADSVCFAGWVTDTTSFYGALDVNMLTSLSETFPYVLTEGARMGCATISSKVGGVPLLIDHGVNGLLFDPGDVDTLSTHMTLLASDSELRVTMGKLLNEKARKLYSIETTVSRQLEIYKTILRRKSASSEKRSGVLICGAYGKGNAGDDAILEAIVAEMRSIDPDIPIYVLSRTPEATSVFYRVRSCHTFNVPGFLRIMRKTRLYLSGGGSLIQDVTSTRSLMYYLFSLKCAKKLGNKTIMYGCGIGPVSIQKNRKKAKKIINNCADIITLRENSSLDELRSMGVNKPEIILSADPALTLSPASDSAVESYLVSNGLDPNGSFICFALRPWQGFEEKIPCFANAADYAFEKYGLIPVFLPIEPGRDIPAAQKVLSGMNSDGYILQRPANGSMAVGVMSRMKVLVSMRLHALIFAAGSGIPLVGVVYDPKVSAFLEYINRDIYSDLSELTDDLLKDEIDKAVALADESDTLKSAVDKLLEMESSNTDAAARLLERRQN